MKSTIRQFLCISASLGLFLGVASAKAGQWWYLDAALPTPNGSVYIMVNNTGPAVCKWKYRRDCFLTLAPRQDSSPLDQVFNSKKWTDILSYKRHYLIDTYALVIIREFNHGAWQGTIIATRHWLVVTFFTLFCGGLKWAYRNRPHPMPGESPGNG